VIPRVSESEGDEESNSDGKEYGKNRGRDSSLKKGDIRNAALPSGSPGWNDILHLTWEEVIDMAKKRQPGFRFIRKLLSDGRFDK
jgi:hypothetical protein